MRPPRIAPTLHEWRMSDGYRVRGRMWNANRTHADLAFVYLHGIQSHGGWFEWSASLLAAGGRAVLLPDRRGSGLNREARGDVPSLKRWNDDVDEVVEWTARELGVARVAVVGVSWGGKLAVSLALRAPRRVARLLLVTPGVFP